MGYLIAAYVVVFGTVAGYAFWVHKERRAADRDARQNRASESRPAP